jgi:ribonucleoside-triphosphate reductase
LEAAGETVFKEYTLLNMLPRDIADAHLSGSLHISNLSTWVLKPTETIHDIRFFLQNGLNLETINPAQPSRAPPQNLDTALATTFNALLHSAKETETTQTLEYFNTFLAPYAKSGEPARTKEILHLFMANLSQHADTAICLELTTPDFLAEKTAIGPRGLQAGKYVDYTEETQQLASMLLETFAEQSAQKPLVNPKLIIKIRPETLRDEKAKAMLLEAHAFGAHNGTPYFANLNGKKLEQAVRSPSGFKIDVEANGDWEIDTLRTGCLGIVTVNVPRVAYESGGDKTRYFETLRERLEMAGRALEIKHQALRQHGRNLLPFLTLASNGDQYFRLEKSIHTINLAGLKEAAEAFTGKSIDDEETLAFAEETAQNITTFISKIGRKRGRRLCTATLPNSEASVRLAELDVERFGVARVHFSGTRDKPYYSATGRLAIQNGSISPPQAAERRIRQLRRGGELTLVELGESEYEPERLLSITRQLTEGYNVEFFTYNRKATYCTNCKRTWRGHASKCPQCSAVSTLTYFDRFNRT